MAGAEGREPDGHQEGLVRSAVHRLGHAVARALASPLRRLARVPGEWRPSVDVEETAHAYTLMADLPEVRARDVAVFVERGVVVIEGERRIPSSRTEVRLHRLERRYGTFVRRFVVPEDVDARGIAADLRAGVLYVHMPKRQGRLNLRLLEPRERRQGHDTDA